MLSEFNYMWDRRLDRISAVEHRVYPTLPSIRPIHSAPYCAGPHAHEFNWDKIDKVLKMHVIELSQMEWAARILFAPKRGGALRFCISYQKLYAALGRDSYLLPRMYECIDPLGEAQIISTLAANSTSKSKKKKIEIKRFSTHITDYFASSVCRLELKMPSETFQPVMDVILATVKWQFSLVYLDYIKIFSKSPSEHLKHVHQVLQLLWDTAATLKLEKFSFFIKTIDYLGHIILPHKLEVETHTPDAICNSKELRNVTDLRFFLGLCNTFRDLLRAWLVSPTHPAKSSEKISHKR